MAEDAGLCTHFRYHKHKLVFFLSSMRSHADQLKKSYPLEYFRLDDDNQHLSYIERLMIAGNLILLSEINPDVVYRWFMEMFADSADWVMVPNVYGMSQFADVGSFATKPYIAGSKYILKMSNYQKGEWTGIVDGLYWRFINKKREIIASNPRMRMMVSSFDKMNEMKKRQILLQAEEFIMNKTWD